MTKPREPNENSETTENYSGAAPAPAAPPAFPIDQRSIRNIFVSQGMSLRYAFFVSAIASACSSALAFGFVTLALNQLSDPSLFLNSERAIAVFESIRLWGFALIAVTALLAFTAFFVGLRQAHRIAGPLYRLNKYLGFLLAGNYGERVTLRESDEFREIADKINTLADRLEAYADPATSLEVTKV